MELIPSDANAIERLIRIGEVKCLTGLSTATIYRKMSAGIFPRPVMLGVAARAWPLSEIQDWVAQRVAERQVSTPKGVA